MEKDTPCSPAPAALPEEASFSNCTTLGAPSPLRTTIVGPENLRSAAALATLGEGQAETIVSSLAAKGDDEPHRVAPR